MDNFFLLLKADEVKAILEGAIGNSHIDLVRVLSRNESSYLRDFWFILDNWHTRYESLCCKHYRVCPSKWLNNKGNFLACMIENSRLRFKCGLIQIPNQFQQDPLFPSLPLSSLFSPLLDRFSPHGCKVAAAAPASCSCNFKSNGTWFLSQKFQCVWTLPGLCSTNCCGQAGGSVLTGLVESCALFLEPRIELCCHKHIF